MCGPAGSGKSTVARQLAERHGMMRLSFDTEAWDRGFREAPLAPAAHREIEDDLRLRLLELIAQDRDVVLDYAFWSRQIRDQYRALLSPLGVEVETIYLATPRNVVIDRMALRGERDPDDLSLPDELVKEYFDHFEAPTPEEGPLTVIG